MTNDDQFKDKNARDGKLKGNVKKDLFKSDASTGKDINKSGDDKNNKSAHSRPLSSEKNELLSNISSEKTTESEKDISSTKREGTGSVDKKSNKSSNKNSSGSEITDDFDSIKNSGSLRKTTTESDANLQVVDLVDGGQGEEENEDSTKPRTRAKRRTSKNLDFEEYNSNFIVKTLSQTLHESMIPYSEFVILDRALPRVEDGLKPVQRRVLYSMLEVGVFPDRPYKKSASIVGECMGKYHPHGDSSIYETLVRMAQPFNMRETLVDGHGNFGSIDGDGAAAMRYTEAKLTPLAMELLKDLEKDTVAWSLNFDDRLKEPNMLPGRFPNLLVNGCQGIAVGLATNIPTHNLSEACNAVIAYIDNRNITLDELMKIMPAPDFPSGAYILDSSEIEQMYRTGKGRIFLRSKINIENADNGKKNIVITEIPYQVNKANMLQKIAKYRDNNPTGPLGYIQEIVDESDRTGTRAVIRLKKDAKINSILNILYKNCDIQTTFGANIVAIANGKPKQMGLIEILEYYVNYQQKVIFNRTNYDLQQAISKAHILEGLLIAIRNIDEVVKIIKTSKNVTEAKTRLMETFELTEIQTQAILDMRLARLTSLEVNRLITDLNKLKELIKKYTAIIKSPSLQMKVVKNELQEIIKTYGNARKTKFLKADEHFEDSACLLDNIANEEEDIQTFHLIANPINTLKIVNLKSYNLVVKELSSNPSLAEVPSISFKVDNNKNVLAFTNMGNSIKIPVRSIDECKFRDKGTPLFNIAKNIKSDENIVSIIEIDCAMQDCNFLFVTKMGMVKISKVKDYMSVKQLINGIKLNKNDELIFVETHNPSKKLTLFTNNGNAVKLEMEDITVSGRVSLGVKGIALDKNDYVVGAMQTEISDAFTLFYNDGSAKIVKQSEVADSARNRKGLSFLGTNSKDVKLVFADKLTTKNNYVLTTGKDNLLFVTNNTLPLDTRLGGGKIITKEKIKKVYKFIENK